MYNINLRTLWFNKRDELQKEALKKLSSIFNSEDWSFIQHFEDPWFGTSLWFFNCFVKKDEAIEIVNTINDTINGVKAKYDHNEEFIIVNFGDE